MRKGLGDYVKDAVMYTLIAVTASQPLQGGGVEDFHKTLPRKISINRIAANLFMRYAKRDERTGYDEKGVLKYVPIKGGEFLKHGDICLWDIAFKDINGDGYSNNDSIDILFMYRFGAEEGLASYKFVIMENGCISLVYHVTKDMRIQKTLEAQQTIETVLLNAENMSIDPITTKMSE